MPRPLHILHLATFYPPYSYGGDGVYIERLARAQADAGHHVVVAHCVDAYRLGGGPMPGSPPPCHPNITVCELRSRYGSLSPLLTHQTGRPLLERTALRRIFARRYDLIHYHNISLLGPAVLESGNDDALRLYTTHEYWLLCPTHLLWQFGKRPCSSKTCLRCVLSHGRPPQLWRYTGLLERAARRVDQFISPSRFSATLHEQAGFAPVAHLPLFYDGDDPPAGLGPPKPQERPYFLFVGRLERIKGLDTLIRVWASVRDYDLLVAGAGAEDTRLRALAAPNPSIRFLGRRTRDELAALYAHALALVVPSLVSESGPLVAVEALAHRTPIIVRNAGGMPELVQESGGGYVYGGDEDLLGFVRELGASPALREQLGENGFRTYLRCWSVDAHMRRYWDIVNEAARRRFGTVPWDPDVNEGIVTI